MVSRGPASSGPASSRGGRTPQRRTPQQSSFRVLIGLVVAVALGFGGYLVVTDGGVGEAATSSTGSTRWDAGVPSSDEAVALLTDLPVKGRSPATGYDRIGRFGESWKDVDGNGCNTRDDILARDLTEVSLSGTCRVLSGTLDDPYTGKRIAFLRGKDTSSQVQIDHVVALMNAWQTGAQALTQEQRIQLANDPLNLVAVDGSTNQAKGASDAATWLPPNTGYRCAYAARQVAVKTKYDLWVTPPERSALQRLLSAC